MKNKFLFLVFLLVPAVAFAQSHITVKGTVKYPQPEMTIGIIYQEGFNQTPVADIPVNSDGTFSQQVELPRTARYLISGPNGEWFFFWGEDEDISIDFHGRGPNMESMDRLDLRINNPGPQNQLVNLEQGIESLMTNMMNYLWQAYSSTKMDEEQSMAIRQEIYAKIEGQKKALYDIMVTNFKDRKTIFRYLGRASAEVAAQAREYLDANYADYQPYVDYKANVAFNESQKNALREGSAAPVFEGTTPDGKTLGLADFRGKYVLVDFWASWCGPCRGAIPHLKALYEKYHNKGLEILAVSIDRSEQQWRMAMEQENMPWPQIVVPEAGQEVTKLYQIAGIPHLVVIDRAGNISAINLRGEALEKKLEEIFR